MLDHLHQAAAVMLERAACPHPAHYCAIAVDPPSQSRKPDDYARVERYSDGPYVDVFAREQRPNRDCWVGADFLIVRADRRELLVVAPLKFAVEAVVMAERGRTR